MFPLNLFLELQGELLVVIRVILENVRNMYNLIVLGFCFRNINLTPDLASVYFFQLSESVRQCGLENKGLGRKGTLAGRDRLEVGGCPLRCHLRQAVNIVDLL